MTNMMREGTKFVAQAPSRIVAMTEFKGRIFVATEWQVFELIDGAFNLMVFVVPDDVSKPIVDYRKHRE